MANALLSADTFENWCPTCCSPHEAAAVCPGPLPATGEERYGWRVSVRTPHGIEAYGILVAASDRQWRARIITHPGTVWIVPGGGGSMKFPAETPQRAERRAAEYIKRHVAKSGFEILDIDRSDSIDTDLEPARDRAPDAVANRPRDLDSVSRGAAEPQTEPRPDVPAEPNPSSIRKRCSIPVSFGHNTHSRDADVANVSERGMFVSTVEPLEPGSVVRLKLDLDSCSMPLRGVVVWSRETAEKGGPSGMGVRLSRPPALYVSYVRRMK